MDTWQKVTSRENILLLLSIPISCRYYRGKDKVRNAHGLPVLISQHDLDHHLGISIPDVQTLLTKQ